MRVNFLLLLCGSCMLMSVKCRKEQANPPVFFEATTDGAVYNFQYGIKARREDTWAGPVLTISGNSNLQGINQISITLMMPDADPQKLVGSYSLYGRRNNVTLSIATDTSTAAFTGTSAPIDSLLKAAGIDDYSPLKLAIVQSTGTYISGTFSGDLFWKGIPGMMRKRVSYGSFVAKYE